MDRKTYGAVIIARNDDYGGNLVERASYAINSMLDTFDEVIYVDWASSTCSLIDDVKHNLRDISKLKHIVISVEKAEEYVRSRSNPQGVVPQVVTEVLGRNIGLRRLTTDFMVSTNVDVLVPSRYYLERFSKLDTFSPAAKNMISLQHVRDVGGVRDDVYGKLAECFEENSYPFSEPGRGQQGPIKVCTDDVWSLVNGNGDFQIAHKDIWYSIRGFEETLIGRGYADGNVQKKALLNGFNIEGRWDIPVFHIGHDGTCNGGGGGEGGWNDVLFALQNFTTCTNDDTWGFSDDSYLEVRTL